MPDSFFQSEKKRKRTSRSGETSTPKKPYEKPYRPAAYGKGQKPVRGKNSTRDEDLSSDAEGGRGVDLDNMDFRKGRDEGDISDEEFYNVNETAAEKRVRLARGYLDKVRDEVEAAKGDDAYDAAEIDRELIASRLQQDVAEAEGRIHLYLGKHVLPQFTLSHFIPTPSHLPTAVSITSKSIYVSTKRGSIFQYSLPSLQKTKTPFGQAHISGPKAKGVTAGEGGHQGEILCLATSEDGKYLVSGGRDKIIGVWDVSSKEPKWIAGMRGHKDAIASIAIPPLNNPSHHILTASLSRHLALHSLSTLSLIDTFFGHQDSITSVSSLKPTIAITGGTRDRTCRWWKVEEEVQLVFRGGGKTSIGVKGLIEEDKKERLGGGWFESDLPIIDKVDKKGKLMEFVEGSIDVVCMLDDQHFLSGGDSGSISLWHTGKKKPVFTKALAHGFENSIETGYKIPTPRWVTSLASLRGTDLFVSGSWDGNLNLWALEPNFRSFTVITSLPISGFINDLQFINTLPKDSIETSWKPLQNSPLSDDVIENSDKKSKSDLLIVAAVGQELRIGRWLSDKTARNGVMLVKLQLDSDGLNMLV